MTYSGVDIFNELVELLDYLVVVIAGHISYLV